MALKGLDSGEATHYPTYAPRATGGWIKVANQPSAWEVLGTHGVYSYAGVSDSGPFTGTTCFRVANNYGTSYSAMRRQWGTDFSETYLSFMVKFDTLTPNAFFHLLTSALATVVRLNIDASGNLLIYAGTTPTPKKTLAAVIQAGTWYQIRLHVKSGTPGTLELILNDGATEDCSGTNMSDWRFVVIGNTSNGTQPETRIDCLQVNDTTGTINNSWPGTPRIPTALRPSSDGALTDWIRNAGAADYETIDEVQPDLDTTYVYSETDDDESSYGFTDLAEPSNAAIVGVCLTIVANRSDAAQLIPLVTRGGSTIELTAVDVPTDYMSPIEVIMELDPITSAAWTQTNLNNTEFGFKHVQV